MPSSLTHWSELIFQGSLSLYHELNQHCQASNLNVVRRQTEDLIHGLLQAVKTPNSSVSDVNQHSDNCCATKEQLEELTLTQLKQLAQTYQIKGRSAMTRNLESARQHLVPKLVGMVKVHEI